MFFLANEDRDGFAGQPTGKCQYCSRPKAHYRICLPRRLHLDPWHRDFGRLFGWWMVIGSNRSDGDQACGWSMLAVVVAIVACEKKDAEGKRSWERSKGLEIVRHDEGMCVGVCECACNNAAMGPSTVSVRM